MDTYREHPSDFDASPSTETPAQDVAAAIGTDERRMHVRAYNYWVSLLNGRDFPSIEDLEPGDVSDFASNSVLLDFTCGRDNPAVPYIGGAIRDECGLEDDTRTIADVPSRSLLSRLTDHYLQIIANRAPIGFEAEFANQREETICYRGILMPFSSDGETIDFIYGVINWKRVHSSAASADDSGAASLLPSLPIEVAVALDEAEAVLNEAASEESVDVEQVIEQPLDLGETVAGEPLELTEPAADEPLELTDMIADEPAGAPTFSDTLEIGAIAGFAEVPETAAVHFSWEDGPLADVDDNELPTVALDESAGLADRLWAARETADAVKAGEGRTRSSLYRALSLAYDFALAAQQNPEEYAELLEESGVKAQARAPMTPIVKLVFGIDYDKARLTEFAAALSYALRQDVGLGDFQDLIEKQPGGLKALVAAERQARRPESKADTKGEVARARLRSVAPISLEDVPAEEEFAVIVTRRGADGHHEPVAIIEDEALVERAIRRAA
ncbi:MAG TPA: hypothetical protein VE820_00770 [Sphingomicrobium sp.]|nr:hypothetical protein [Sphingomicrobium sp.]